MANGYINIAHLYKRMPVLTDTNGDHLIAVSDLRTAIALAAAETGEVHHKQSEGEWISVEERLPERMKPVLVLATSRYEEDGYDVLIAYHDGGEWEEQCVHSHECCVFYIYADVKFWMPLPEPPEPPKGE